MLAVRQGFVPARSEPKASCGVPESASNANNAAALLAVRQGFEPVEPRFSKLVMTCGFGA
jgi:hypothetical protein